MILINPAAPDRMGMISRYSPLTLPMAAGILAGCLLSQGKKVKIIDELVCPVDKDLKEVDSVLGGLNKPYIFGISCLTINIARSFKIAGLLKKKYPDSIIILGGIHPTALPEEALNQEGIDIVVRGEAEQTLPLLYEAVKNSRSYSDIQGISFKENNRIIHNPDQPLVQDLDTIPPFPFQLFDANKYKLGFIIASRGCPYSCIFCSQRLVSGKKYRFRPPLLVVNELDLLINKYNQRSISFFDDNLLIDREKIEALCRLIIKNKLNLKAEFSAQARADNINQDVLKILKQAGFTCLGLGIETASERLMKVIGKGETLEQNIKASRLIKRMGFGLSGFFMFGIPGETAKDRLNAYLLSKQLKFDYAKFNNIVPYPGTKLLEIAREEGSLNISGYWENFNSVEGVVGGIFSKSKLPYVPLGTSERQLKRDLVRANLYFYWSHLASLFAPARSNPGWFILPKRWFLRPKEYYYLLILGLKVMLNCIVVFDLKWFFADLLRLFRKRNIL